MAYPTPGVTRNYGQALLDAMAADATARLSSWPMYVYGHSYAVFNQAWYTAGKHYLQLANAKLGGGTINNYAISGKRILDVLSGLINESPLNALVTVPIAGAKWPGTSSRSGLVVLESSFNDCGHYPAMNVAVPLPALLPTANNNYRNSTKNQNRAALALMSSESRIENAAFTVSGTWTRASAQTYASGGLLDFTTAVGAYCEVSATPAQAGPLAGKVFLLIYTLDPATGTMAPINVSIDGGAPTLYTPTPWEKYTGPSGGNCDLSVEVIPVTLPVDTAAHTIRFTHAGSAGNLFYNDCLLIPSETPNPIAVKGYEHGPKVSGVYNQAQVNTFKANIPTMSADLKTVVAEFPNAIYVASNMTTSGIYSADGIHPNDMGMAQRASDLVNALMVAKSSLDARALSLASGYAIL
jgi:hypothetical protein